MCAGRFAEAIREIKRALELDPLSLVINRNYGQVLYRAGKYDQARLALQKTLEMDPNFSYTHFHLGQIALQKGRYEEALAELQKEKEMARGWEFYVEAWIGLVYAKMGQRDRAVDVLDELVKKATGLYVSPTLLSLIYFSLSQDNRGFQMLNQAYEEYDYDLGRLLNREPAFDRVRPDPRFQEMLKKVGLK
jgi:predicted Zn-dependent protease